jgi:hypothetical protein
VLQRPPSSKPPSKGARRRELRRLRTARYRRNQAGGLAVALVPYNGEILNFLVRTHWLDGDAAGDRRAVGAAIGRLLADSAKI